MLLRGNNSNGMIEMWTEPFSILMHQLPIVDNLPVEILNVIKLPIETGAFKVEELMISIGLMSNGKSFGLKNIPA